MWGGGDLVIFLLNSGHDGDLEIANVYKVMIVVKIWSKIIGNMSIAKGMYLAMGLLLKGKNLEAKSTISIKGFKFCMKKNLNVASMIKIQNRD